MVQIVVLTKSAEMLCLKVYDPNQKNTVFTERKKTIIGKESLFVRMPLSSNVINIQIYNEKNGDLPSSEDSSFKILGVKMLELDVILPQTNMDTFEVTSFVRFAQKFCYNAGWIDANKDYKSSNGKYKIEYLPYIVSSKTGQKMQTPARISTKDGRIQVSQEAFVPFTIPMRMAILLHEFSHYFINTDISNEIEADLNGITVYLALGYPIADLHNAFGVTFVGYPTEENKKRYDIINSFIKNFITKYNLKNVYANGVKNK
jgi:hypothetical protein